MGTHATFEVVCSDRRMLLGCCGSLGFYMKRGQNEGGNYEEARRLHQTLSDRCPDGYVFLNVVTSGTGMPSDEARATAAKITSEFEKNFRAQALVLEGKGLWLSSMRMIGKAMLMTMPRSYPVQFFGDVGEAVPWLHQTLAGEANFDPLLLLKDLEVARRAWETQRNSIAAAAM